MSSDKKFAIFCVVIVVGVVACMVTDYVEHRGMVCVKKEPQAMLTGKQLMYVNHCVEWRKP